MDWEDIRNILKNTQDSIFLSMEIFTPKMEIKEADFEKLFLLNPRLCKLTFFASSRNAKIFTAWPVFEITQDLSENAFQSDIDVSQMRVDIEIFKESIDHSLFYNKKIILNQEGDIYETIFEALNRTNMPEKKLENIFCDDLPAGLWNIPKKEIDVCCVCEFRNMCVDSEMIIKIKNGTMYRKSECNYNPYIAKWAQEDGYKTLENCGVYCTHTNFTIDYSKLEKINNDLYELH